MIRAALPLALLLIPGIAQAARGDVRHFNSQPDWSAVVEVIAPPATPWRVRPDEARLATRPAPLPARSQQAAR